MLPVVHRRFADPSPLGLYSFATGSCHRRSPKGPYTHISKGIFLLSIFGVQARGVSPNPNIFLGVLLFFTGFCQYISGIMEFIAGNTFGATVFNSYASFAFSYALIFFPAVRFLPPCNRCSQTYLLVQTGIMAAYTEPGQTTPGPEFDQAVSLYLWAWFGVTFAFCIAAWRSSVALLGALVFFELDLLLLASGYMTGSQGCIKAGNAIGFIAAFCSYWAASAGLWAGDLTPIRLPYLSLAKRE